jgi:hypothetical protein
MEVRRQGVFENRVLRRIFGSNRDEVTREWIKLHNEELHDLYSSPSILRIMKSRRMRWAGHAARIGEKRKAYKSLSVFLQDSVISHLVQKRHALCNLKCHYFLKMLTI